MDDQTDSNPFISVHTPIALVALALSALFFGQIKGTSQATESMKWQSSNADKQIQNYREALLKLDKVIGDQGANTTQAEQTQKQFSDFMKDINDMAVAGDKDAIALMNIAAQAGIKYAGNGEAPKKEEAPKKDK